MREYIASLLEMAGTWYFVAAQKLYHWAGAHYHCARFMELADFYEESMHWHHQMHMQHMRAKSAKQN